MHWGEALRMIGYSHGPRLSSDKVVSPLIMRDPSILPALQKARCDASPD